MTAIAKMKDHLAVTKQAKPECSQDANRSTATTATSKSQEPQGSSTQFSSSSSRASTQPCAGSSTSLYQHFSSTSAHSLASSMGDDFSVSESVVAAQRKKFGRADSFDSADSSVVSSGSPFPTPEKVNLGELVGKGGFCEVLEVKSILNTSGRDEGDLEEDGSDDTLLSDEAKTLRAENQQSNTPNKTTGSKPAAEDKRQHFVAKRIRASRKFNASVLADLTQEANILSMLPPHPNLIGLQSVVGTADEKDLTLIMERCTETLVHRIHQVWRKQMKKPSAATRLARKLGFGKKRSSSSDSMESTQQSVFQQQLQAVTSIASLLDHLHKRNIVHRDIKPENCGFTADGTLKVFDFGAAMVLPVDTRGDGKVKPYHDGQYLLTRLVGTHPYCSPEVSLDKPQGLSMDVYSWAIVSWEILTCKFPFANLMSHEYIDRVIHRGERPPMEKFATKWPEVLQQVLSDGWKPNPTERPSMRYVLADLAGLEK